MERQGGSRRGEGEEGKTLHTKPPEVDAVILKGLDHVVKEAASRVGRAGGPHVHTRREVCKHGRYPGNLR